MTLVQVLFIVSLSLYFSELILFYLIKRKLKGSSSDSFDRTLSELISKLDPQAIGFYSLFYFGLLFLAQWASWVMTLLLTLQFISISVDIFVYFKIGKEQ